MRAFAGNCGVTMSNEPRGQPLSPTPLPQNLAGLESRTLLSALQFDPRPTFILDLEHPESSPYISVLNPALEARPNLCNALKKTAKSALTPTSQIIYIHGLEWDHYTIGGQWRVVSTGARTADIQLPWTGSASFRPSNYPDTNQDNHINTGTSLKRKTSDTVMLERLTSPPVPLKIPEEHEPFMSLFDWESMSIGPIHTWPRQLREWFLMILVDPRPACLHWAEHGARETDLTFLYNEAHIAVLGDNHPSVMGLPVQEAFPQLWKEINEPLFDQMVKTRRPFLHKALPVSYSKDGTFMEERYFDWTSMPVLDNSMEVTGAYQSLMDVTQNVLEQKRSRTLAAIGAIVTKSQVDNIWDRIIENLSDNKDIPHALVYSLSSGKEDPASFSCKLEGSVGFKQSVGLENFQLDNAENEIAKILRHAMELDQPLYLSKRKSYGRSDLWLQVPPADSRRDLCDMLPTLLKECKLSSMDDPCDSVTVMPIQLTHSQQTRGFAILGLNARLPYDLAYHSFITLLQKTVSATMSSALLWREDQLSSKEAEIAHADLSAQLLRSTKETKAIESRFSQLARHAPVGICIYSADGAMAFANNKWYSLTDFSKDADNKSPGWWAPIVHPDDMSIAFASFSQLQFDKEPVHFEIRLAVASKQFPSAFTWVLVSAYPETRDDEELESIVACFTDITEQKWAAETERRRTSEALEAKSQQENFIDVTSHEIRNPLSVSLQCSEEISTIARNVLDTINLNGPEASLPISDLKDILNAAEVIEQCTMHQRRIVDDILTLSKMEGGMLPFNLSPAQPMLVVKNILKIFSREFVHSGIEITLHPDPSFEIVTGELEWLELDPGRLSQMIINLLTNAIKFTKTQTQRHIELTIGASTALQPLDSHNLIFLPVLEHETSRIGSGWNDNESVYLHIMVTDTGSGISAEDQESVFSRFSQGCTKDYTQYGGSGLGLYICRALVEIHGGRIGFTSICGQGSTFGFCLKTRRVRDVEVKLPSKSLNKASKLTNGNGVSAAFANHNSVFNILIVEDNLINQQVLQKQLKKAGHIVTIANHGQECLDILAETTFCKTGGNKLSVLLMDVEMPVMNGVDCTKVIRKMEKEGRIQGHVPIIATTGNARNEKVELIKDAGVDRVILKPYSVPDLLLLICNLIAGRDGMG